MEELNTNLNMNIPTKSLGLNKADVESYINNLLYDHKKILNNLLKEIKMLERTKEKLLLELKDVKTEDVTYVEETEIVTNAPKALVADARKNLESTIVLIHELANRKIEQMSEKAADQLTQYDETLEKIQKEIDENKEKIELLLGDIINLLKTNMDDVYPKEEKKAKDNQNIVKVRNDNIINFLSEKNKTKKSPIMVPQDVEEKVIKRLETYFHSKDEFVKHLDQLLNSGNSKGTVMLVEINEFVIANYFINSSSGDVLIDETIERMRNINDNLYIVRLAYDQLGIICDGMDDIESISKIANIILKRIQKSMFINGKKIELSANIGISMYPKNANTSEEIMNYAGIALFKAKEMGKGFFKFINEDLISEVELNNDFKFDLVKAIENDELFLHYQPIYATSNDELEGFEALLRWPNDKYNKLPIINVIRTAEKEDLIDDIGKMILRKACGFIKKIQAKSKKKIVVSVNFSALQIINDEFLSDVKEIIQEMEVSTEYLGFEITESCFMENFEETCAKIEELKNMGITISIDDFGTGYSTLSYLLKLPVSIVKIDKTFLDDLTTNDKCEKFIESIINISHDLGLKVVSEGVETSKQCEMLRDMKCDYLQGYFLAKPLPEAEAYMYI